MMKQLTRYAIGIALACIVGCGGTPPSGSQFDMSGQQKMGELMELLSSAQLTLKRPPANIKELEKCARAGPFAFEAVSKGDFVVVWKATLGQGNAVVAYQKDVPAQGGWVILQDRTVKTMTAVEFQAAPKASP